MRSNLTKALRICTAWAVLVAIIACGGNEEEIIPSPTAAADPVVPSPVEPTAAPSGEANVSLSPGFMPDPHKTRGQASGAAMATTLGAGAATCAGMIPAAPQHTLTLQSDFANLRVLVNSATDTNLVIRKPDGTFACADDVEGLNPIVEGAFPAGTYQVYVGTYNSASSGPYVIGFTELISTTAASLGS